MAPSVFRKGISLFFEYDTPKIVHINSKKVGVINRLIQLCIIAYVIGYAIVYKKGYQEFDEVVSGVTTKVKGVVYVNRSEVNITGIGDRLFDVTDYVIPPQENDAFFVMTNMVVTSGQTQNECPEDPGMVDVNCTDGSPCPAGKAVLNGNGVRTGVCVDVPAERYHTVNYTGQKVCQIKAWCPVEVDEMPIPGRAVLGDSQDFTVLIKNNIQFPKFSAKRRNILETSNQTFLRSCRFDKDDPVLQYCPIFELGKIVGYAGENYTELAYKGGVIVITIRWDCNLDFDITECKPEYSFRRLDNKDAKISAGYNFRYANYYKEKDIDSRELIKAYGIRFLVSVTGEAGKFNLVPLLTNIGSGLALLSIATIMSDIVVLYLLKKRFFYQEKKYQYVTGDDAYESGSGNPPQYGSTEAVNKSDTSAEMNEGTRQRDPQQKDGYTRMSEDQ